MVASQSSPALVQAYLHLFYVSGYFACASVYHLSAWVPTQARRGCQVTSIGAAGGGEPPCGCQESNSGPLEEPVLLTAEMLNFPTTTNPTSEPFPEVRSHLKQQFHKLVSSARN